MIEQTVVKTVNRALGKNKYFEQTVVQVDMKTKLKSLKYDFRVWMDKVDLEDLIDAGTLSKNGVIDFDDLQALLEFGNVDLKDVKEHEPIKRQ